MFAPEIVVLPVRDLAQAEAALPWAQAIVGGWPGSVVLFALAGDWPGRSARRREQAELRRELTELAGVHTQLGSEPLVSVDDGVWAEVLEGVSRLANRLLLLPWTAHVGGARLDLRSVLAEPPCDLALLRLGTAPPFRKVLLALRGGPDAALALRVALAAATARSAQITALHAVPYAPRAQSDAPFHDLRSALKRVPAVARVLALREPCAAAILRQAPGHDLLVMEASTQFRGSGEDIDMVARTVLHEASCTVLAAKSRLAFALPCRYSNWPGPEVRETKRFHATFAK